MILHKAVRALFAKLPGNSTVFEILFTFVTKLHKLVRWFDSISEEEKQITRDAISHR